MRRILALAGLVALAASCKEVKPDAHAPQQSLEDFTMTRSKDGVPVWLLQSRVAFLREDSKKALLSEPRLEVRELGKPILRAQARRGTAHIENHDVLLSGAAKLFFVQEDSTLETEELMFVPQTRQFRSDREVVLRRPGAVVRGTGCVAGSDLSEVKIFNQKSVIQPGASAPMRSVAPAAVRTIPAADSSRAKGGSGG
ncbi:MAG: LPS export ABC transporter periplasmic protein LptC [Elusimicrobia bacterium]|nr:LPS export ABC transporter periplasmic protein LptC [Elusimicrobiota bacterium]